MLMDTGMVIMGSGLMIIWRRGCRVRVRRLGMSRSATWAPSSTFSALSCGILAPKLLRGEVDSVKSVSFSGCPEVKLPVKEGDKVLIV